MSMPQSRYLPAAASRASVAPLVSTRTTLPAAFIAATRSAAPATGSKPTFSTPKPSSTNASIPSNRSDRSRPRTDAAGKLALGIRCRTSM